MPRKTLCAVALPLLAALARSLPGPAVAGPPERVSGRMVLEDVAVGLREYRKERDEGKRIAWLRRLAPSRDPRVAVELWQVFAWESGKRSAAIRQVARDCLADYYVPRKGRPLPEAKPSDEERGADVCSWWSRSGADIRRRAKQLPQ